ncbi:hypothetical protein, unlikely [Trypanosoma brucei gambiense DAL972]|uniref:Uncharacterized protein n=1 Tax=Trypanosoma brucei gambiense (strain MHOM/CI/86/DAL972) TaxID=679716 RepID=C9ZYR4_TRYB9|nr:hypothetical protein, unlikely [Trypanosoma brucei gambiense DAL972]CBH14563.1 hypothetical protein, unlikely [Trypanosoma brucei gambiense DAL972]|eukprot:XP_011776829.1 hypothetical protein, unlikely [Trypanosoma brucei gambiense DAL972]
MLRASFFFGGGELCKYLRIVYGVFTLWEIGCLFHVVLQPNIVNMSVCVYGQAKTHLPAVANYNSFFR